MKRILVVLLALTLVLLAGCGNANENSLPGESSVSPAGEARNIKLIYASGYENEANTLKAALEGAHCSVTAAEYEKDISFDGDVIVLGYVNRKAVRSAVSAFAIHDYAMSDLGDYFYIGGRADFDGIASAVTRFTEKYVTGKEYLITSGVNDVVKSESTLDKAVVNGVSLADYTIVYNEIDGIATYADVAELYGNSLKTKTTTALPVVSEKTAETERELIVGATATRAESKKYRIEKFAENEYVWEITDSKIVVVGGSVHACNAGLLSFISYLERCEGTSHSGSKTEKGSCPLVRVACVGDSITQGDSNKFSYPGYLQKMLGYDYIVKNYGVSGYSVREQDKYSYMTTSQYKNAVSFKPDVVIYMLGTNDCQPTKSWTDTTKLEYKESSEKIFKAFTEANKGVNIFVCLPSSLFANTVWEGWETWAKQVREYAVPLNDELAKSHDYNIIDVYDWSLDNQSVFPDGLHPKNESYEKLAEFIYDTVKDKISAVR